MATGAYSWEHELEGYQQMIPDMAISEHSIFPTEEGVGLWVVREGTVADNVRSRSLGLAGTKARIEDVEYWFTTDDFKIAKHVQMVPRIEAPIALCIGVDAAATINSGGSAEAYLEAVKNYETTGRFVDPGQPAVAKAPEAAWLVEGKSVPMPLG